MQRLAFFLSNRRCPYRCIYCDQGAITGERDIPSPEYVRDCVKRAEQQIELCFFGGSFTCLDMEEQKNYLDTVYSAPYGSTVRFSTHPLCINEKILRFMKGYPVSMIELGISSLSNRVLSACRRGYDDKGALSAMDMVVSEGFSLGAQIMIGLPYQDESSSMQDIDKIAEIARDKPVTLRIYPCLVLRNTYLEKLYMNGHYKPLDVEEAAIWSGKLLNRAISKGLKVQRIGLQETDSLKESVIAGPHHPALGEMARSEALALSLTSEARFGPWKIPENRISLIRGHGNFGLKILSSITGLDEGEVLARISFI